jgi:hypothetical protein
MTDDPVRDVYGNIIEVAKLFDPRDGTLDRVYVKRTDPPLTFILSADEVSRLAVLLADTVADHDPRNPNGQLLPDAELAADMETLHDPPRWDQPASPFTPGAGQRGRAIALYDAYGTPQWERELLDYCRDLHRDKAAPAALWAAVGYGHDSLAARQGHGLTAARIREDLKATREDAGDEYEEHDSDDS